MKLRHKNKELLLPDFLIVGAAKSGTTSLYGYLSQHPEIFMSNVKEPMFFAYMKGKQIPVLPNTKKIYRGLVTDIDQYSALFQDAENGQIIGEASTWYLYLYNDVISNIKELYLERYKELKIIIVLRDPTMRAWSHYTMRIRDGIEPLDFKTAIKDQTIKERLSENVIPTCDYIGFGMYYHQVKAYMDNFKNVHVILFEDLCQSLNIVISGLYSFLGVRDIEFKPDSFNKLNTSGIPRGALNKILDRVVFKDSIIKRILKNMIPKSKRYKMKLKAGNKILTKLEIPHDIRNELKTLYREEIIKLQDLINRDLSSWLK